MSLARFTIIIPTRNRTAALRMTLAGLALQRTADVTFAVSDNSDPDSAEDNRAVVAEVLAGRPHVYLRPPRVLSMVAHWNFALAEAPRSDFTGFVTDRMTLAPDALSLCDEVLRATGSPGVCFHSNVVSAINGTDLPPWPETVEVRRLLSTEVLSDFARSRLRKDSPRFLNSVVSRDVLDDIARKFGAVFGGIAPDYAFTFRFLDVVADYHHLDASLLFDHSPQISNGMAVTRNIGNAANNDFIARLMSEQASEFAAGPIPNETRLLNNVILREMEIARASAREPVRFPPVDAQAFHLAAASALRRSNRVFDADTRLLQAKIEAYRIRHSLPAWSARVRRSNLAVALRNSLARWFGKAALPGVTRDAAGDARLLNNLQALGRPRLVLLGASRSGEQVP